MHMLTSAEHFAAKSAERYGKSLGRTTARYACVLQTLCKCLPFDAAARPCASLLRAEVVALLVLPIVSTSLPGSLIHILTAAWLYLLV